MTTRRKLKECCDFIDYRGKTPEKSESGYRLITAKNVKDYGFSYEPAEYIPKENYDEVMVRGIPQSGDILFTTEAPLGNVCRIPEFNEPFAVGQRIIVIQPKKGLLNTEYFEHLLKSTSFRDQMMRRSSGSTVKGIRSKELVEIEIEFPDIQEQKRIADEINTTKKIIETRQQQVEQFDLLVQSRFVEIFGDLIINPKGWELSNFEELTLLITDGEHNTPKRVDKGIYLLSARNILNHKLQLNDVDYIDEREYERIAKRVIPQVGDVLISCSGSVGRCCSVPEGLKFQMVRSVAILRFKNIIRPKFAEYMITSDFIQRQIDASKTASSQANLFQGKIARLKGFVPPMELQMEFEKFISQVEKSKFPYSQSKHSLTAEIIFQNR